MCGVFGILTKESQVLGPILIEVGRIADVADNNKSGTQLSAAFVIISNKYILDES